MDLFKFIESLFSKELQLIDYIHNNKEDLKICNGCDTIIAKDYNICPHCKSYNFSKLTDEILKELDKDSKYIEYPIPLE